MQRRRLKASRKAGLLERVSALALIKRGSLSPGLDQKGTSPHLSSMNSRFPSFASRMTGICVVGATLKRGRRIWCPAKENSKNSARSSVLVKAYRPHIGSKTCSSNLAGSNVTSPTMRGHCGDSRATPQRILSITRPYRATRLRPPHRSFRSCSKSASTTSAIRLRSESGVPINPPRSQQSMPRFAP
jgi:hypothetical protein